MARINDHYLKLPAGYLFPEIGRRVARFAAENPQAAAKIIRMGIGDVTEPLPPAVIEAMHKAVDEMGRREAFRGYGPEQGYDFLRTAIAEHDYRTRGVQVSPDEIFVSDGSKCDTGNILDVFGPENVVAITDPVYPVYVDTNVMAGRGGRLDESGRFSDLVYLPVTAENNFVPALPTRHVDLIYLCYPNNPTGTVATRDMLARWVDYAKQNGSIILFDAAYEAYIASPGIPHSIFEIPGAGTWRSNFAASARRRALPGRAAPSPWCRRRCSRTRPMGRRWNCIGSGVVGTQRSSTALRTWSNVGPKPAIRRRAKSNSAK